jgi:hypothetical protein
MRGAGWATALSLNASHKGRIEISLQQSRSLRPTATHPTTHNPPTYPLLQNAEPSPTSAPHVGAAANVDRNPRAGSKRASALVEDEEDEEDVEGPVKKQVQKGGSGVAHELAATGQTDMIGKVHSVVEDDMLLVQLVAEERTSHVGAGTFWSRVLHRWQSDRRGSSIERTALDLKDRWCIITGTGNGKDLPADAMVRCGAASSHPQTYLP